MRLRALREMRGLTQADVAQTDFSKGFISLLETGRTRVSLRAAEIIAGRLGVPVSDLMSEGAISSRGAEVRLLRAETALGVGDTETAVELIASIPKGASASLRVRAQRVRGRALVQSGQAREGVKELEAAIRLARQSHLDELAVRLLYDLTQAYEALDEPGSAIEHALQCDARLQSGELVDRTLELEVRSSLAIGFMRLGDMRSAQTQADRALALLEDVSDKRALASVYATLTATRQEQGDLEAALTYAHRAVAAMEQLGQASAVVAALNNVAYIHMQRGEFRRADELLDRAQHLAQAEHLRSIEAALAATRAEVRLAQGASAESLKCANEAIALPDANAQTRGLAMVIAAQAMAELKRSAPEIAKAFERAISALKNSPRLQARAHRLYADYLSKHGKVAAAYAEAQKAVALLERS
ncbi:MAG: helix-turn-helix domain-containing protein [Deltaproteobacteria bacterium]